MGRSAFVVGMGEVGRRLAAGLESVGWTVRPVTRKHGWESACDAGDPSPRLIAVREEALADVLDRLGSVDRSRLVLLQNGFLEAVHGPLGAVGRGIVWFTSKREFFLVLRPSTYFGGLAADVAGALDRGGIASETLADERAFLREMIVKGMWNAVVGLPLAVHDCDLRTLLREHRGEIETLCDEVLRAAAAHYGVAVDPHDALRTLDETTVELGWVRGSPKALAWRNGAVAWFSRRHGVATPLNDSLLRAVGYDPDTDTGASRLRPR